MPFENSAEKGENAGKPAFSPFSTLFSVLGKKNLNIKKKN